MPVNVDDSLLSTWRSEDLLLDEPFESECNWFNFTFSYSANFCDVFVVSRAHQSTIHLAAARALRCAARAGVECVLSSEVGLAIPAAFLAQHGGEAAMRAVVAPRVLAFESRESNHVRVDTPGGESRTVLMNSSVRVEFLTASRRVVTEEFRGADSFCLQLLVKSYDKSCWRQLGG